MKLRPESCAICGSSQFVPIVTGAIGGKREQLEVLGMASIWGSCDLATRMPLWECADCGHAVDEDMFLWGNGTTLQAKEYKRYTDELLSCFQPVDEQTLIWHRGKRFLKGFVRGYLKGNTCGIRIYGSESGFVIEKIGKDDTRDIITNKHFCKEWFDCMIAFASKCEEIPVRVGAEVHTVKIEVLIDTEGAKQLILRE
jgi:hypothetical protein